MRDIYRSHGFTVIRAAASAGGADLVCFNEHEIHMVEVKKPGREYYAQAKSEAKAQLRQLVVPPGVKRLAWIRPKGRSGWDVWALHVHELVPASFLGGYPVWRCEPAGTA